MVVQSVERAVSTISLGVGSLVPDPGADPWRARRFSVMRRENREKAEMHGWRELQQS